jgi:hypothetical protein
MSMIDYVDNEPLVRRQIELEVEELEAVVTPHISYNHNGTIVGDDVELSDEELEEVIAPIGKEMQHNETLVNDEVE